MLLYAHFIEIVVACLFPKSACTVRRVNLCYLLTGMKNNNNRW